MINLTSTELMELRDQLRECVEAKRNKGRGKRCKQSRKDAMFMLLTVLKHGGQWDFLELMFTVSAASFKRVVVTMLEIVCDYACKHFVEDMLRKYCVSVLDDITALFRYYPYA